MCFIGNCKRIIWGNSVDNLWIMKMSLYIKWMGTCGGTNFFFTLGMTVNLTEYGYFLK